MNSKRPAAPFLLKLGPPAVVRGIASLHASFSTMCETSSTATTRRSRLPCGRMKRSRTAS